MILHNHPIEWYLQKIRAGEHFSLGMYGDGEWQCIFNAFGAKFTQNAEKTDYTPQLTQRMLDSLRFSPNPDKPPFYFAAPDTFKTNAQYFTYEKQIDVILGRLNRRIEFVEKNVWHREMCEGNLYPVIKELRSHNLVIVSNKMLRGLDFLKYDKFVEVGYPNAFQDMQRAVKECLEYGKAGIYIFACGIPAALFVQALHGKIKDSWFLDLGSIWDGFVGIGGQRATRREFYLHPEDWLKWVNKNLAGGTVPWEIKELPKVSWHGMGSLDINPTL